MIPSRAWISRLSADLDLSRITQRLGAAASLDDVEKQALRDLIAVGPPSRADAAMILLHAYPAQTNVTLRDRHVLEATVDHGHSAHAAALALSLLCNWLSLASQEVGRILWAIADRTHEDDFLCIQGCSCAAWALQRELEPRLARALVQVFGDETRSDRTRESARDALLRIDGMTSHDIILAERSGAAVLQDRAEEVAKRFAHIV